MVKSEVTQMMKDGQNEAQVLQHFVDPGNHLTEGGHLGKSGQALLSEPSTRTGRLVLYVPYVLGLIGALAALSMAVTWSRRPALAGPAAMLDDDAAIRSRLDDELRDLD